MHLLGWWLLDVFDIKIPSCNVRKRIISLARVILSSSISWNFMLYSIVTNQESITSLPYQRWVCQEIYQASNVHVLDRFDKSRSSLVDLRFQLMKRIYKKGKSNIPWEIISAYRVSINIRRSKTCCRKKFEIKRIHSIFYLYSIDFICSTCNE